MTWNVLLVVNVVGVLLAASLIVLWSAWVAPLPVFFSIWAALCWEPAARERRERNWRRDVNQYTGDNDP